MKEFKVISIDMFRTLVDLETVEYDIWRVILADRYTDALAEEFSAHAGNSLFDYLPVDGFIPLKSLFHKLFTALFANFNIEYNPDYAAKVWVQQHSMSKPFREIPVFLNSAGKKYLICLATDADDDMLVKLKDIYPFDSIFTSEKLGVYKADADGRFFKAIISHYGVIPDEIIHIGDGRREILSAHEAGMVTCWLNRKGLEWQHDIKPDYEVGSLIEAASVLDIDISYG